MLRGVVAGVALAAAVATAHGQPAQHGAFVGAPFAGAPFAFEVFTRQQGAPENSFYAIAPDRHGRLALGMINGAGMFNGTAFRRLDAGDATPHGATVYSVAVDREDRLWVGTPKGLYVGGEAGWRLIAERNGLPNAGVNHVRYAAAGERGLVYVATQGGVAIFDASLARTATIDARDGLPGDNVYVTLDVAAGPLAGLWVGGPWGLAHRAPGAPKFRVVAAPATPAEQATRALYHDDERQALWVGTEAGLVRVGSDGAPAAVAEVRDAPVGSIVRISRRGGSSWLCAARVVKGFSCLAGGTWREFHLIAEPGTERAVFGLASAGTANGADVLWAATDSGLVRAVAPAVQRLAGGPALLQRRIDGIVAARDGALWVASGADVARIAWPRWSLWHLADDDIRALRELPGAAPVDAGAPPVIGAPVIGAPVIGAPVIGAPVIVAAGTGLGKILTFDGETVTPQPFTLALGSGITDLASVREPGGSTLWIGINGALWSWDGQRTQTVTTSDGPRSLWIAKLLATPRDDARDDLWAGLNSTGLARRRAGAWQNLGDRDGVDESDNVTALFADRGALWIGLQAAGVRRLSPLPDPTRAEHFTESTTPALPDGTINSIAADRAGRIYLCTNRGIGRLESRGAGAGFAIRTLGRDDGMPDEECSMNAAATDASGRVFLGTMHGLVFVAPDLVDDKPRPAELVLERAAHGATALTDGARLAHDDNKLVFEYALVVPDHAREISYQTQLIGAEAEPEAWTPRTRREFTGLSAGSYEFVVTARDHLGHEHGPVARRFRIAPPLWATPWAYAAYLAIAALAVLAVVRARIRVLRARAEHLEREVERRTEEVRKQAAELRDKNEALEQSYRQADRIFAALKQAMPGTVLDDRFLLHEAIGEGGFGVVYRCSEVKTGDIYAAKMFKPKPGNDSPEAIERFKREAVTVSRVKHGNAVTVIDGGVSADGLPYIIMELLQGRVLDAELDAVTKLSVARTAEILAPVCDVLAVAHAEGLVHRDIKPENVFLHRDATGREVIKVLDFGVAKLLDDSKASLRSLTASGSLVGTPQYMAPERLSEQTYDGRSDIYAVGVILFQCLIGQLPFPSDGNLFAMIVTQMKTPPPRLVDLDPTIPEGVQRTVLATLEKDPERRPSAAELAAQLRQWAAVPAADSACSVSSDRSISSDR